LKVDQTIVEMLMNTGLLITFITILCTACATTLARQTSENQPMRIYIGGFTGPASKGIYQSTLDPATGELSPAALAAEVDSPSYIGLHPTLKILYAVSETYGPSGGTITSFSIDSATGNLRKTSEQSTGGAGPCYVSVDAKGKFALVSNYGSGSVAAVALDDQGLLVSPTLVKQHAGSGPNAERQKQPHAHSITPAPGDEFAIACDLGTDQLLVYRIAGPTVLDSADPAFTKTNPGDGPRVLAFGLDGRFAYVVNELTDSIGLYEWDPHAGRLSLVLIAPTLPMGVTARNTVAHIAIHPNGKFAYATNRGHDSMAFFNIDVATGQLTPAGHVPTGGKTPRNFAIDPTGKFIIVANQNSNSLVVFRIDQANGTPSLTGSTIEVQSPTCVQFVRP